MPFTFTNKEKATAIFILTGAFLLIVWISLIVKGSDLIRSKQWYYSYLTDTHGFTGGTDIAYKGFSIGKISSMDLSDDDRIRVDFYIYKDHVRLMRDDSVLKIQSSLFGSSSLLLVNTQDPASKPAVPEGMIYSSDMNEGLEILKQQELLSKSGDELTDKVKVILDDVHSLKPVLDSTLMNTATTMDNLSALLAGLRGTSDTKMSRHLLALLSNISDITSNVKTTTERLNKKDNSVGALLQDNGSMLKKMDKLIMNLDKTSENLAALTGATDPKNIDLMVKMLAVDLEELRRLLKGMQKVFGKEK